MEWEIDCFYVALFSAPLTAQSAQQHMLHSPIPTDIWGYGRGCYLRWQPAHQVPGDISMLSPSHVHIHGNRIWGSVPRRLLRAARAGNRTADLTISGTVVTVDLCFATTLSVWVISCECASSRKLILTEQNAHKTDHSDVFRINFEACLSPAPSPWQQS